MTPEGPEHMHSNTRNWLAGKSPCFGQNPYSCCLGHFPWTGDYLISQDHEPIVPPCQRCRERLTSLPDRRIGQRELDDWKSLHRFYVVVAKYGSHTIVQHRSRSTTGSSEALVGQSPRSTFSKHFTQEPLRRMTGEDQSLVSICVSSFGRVPPSGGRCCQIVTESVTARPFRVTGTDQGSANVRALIPRLIGQRLVLGWRHTRRLNLRASSA